MTELHTDNLEGGALEHLRKRADRIANDLRKRGDLIDQGDPYERQQLRTALLRHAMDIRHRMDPIR